MGERKDLEVYSMAVRTASGDMYEWQEQLSDSFISYIEHGTTQYLDGMTRQEALPVTFNYERWLAGVESR